MTESTDLIVAEQLNPKLLFIEGEGVDELLESIRKKAFSFGQDVSTPEGQQVVKSTAYQISRSKTFLDEIGKRQVEEQQKLVDKSKVNRKKIKTYLDDLKTEYRKPLTEWEEAEKKREEAEKAAFKAKVDDRMNQLAGYNAPMPYDIVATMTDEEFDENLEAAKKAWENEQERIAAEKKAEEERREAEEVRQREEAERLEAIRRQQEAETAKLHEQQEALEVERRKIEEEKRRIELEEAKKKAAEEARIQAEKEAKERAEREAREAQEKAEREAREAEERAKAEEAERQRLEKLRPDKEKLKDYAQKVYDITAGNLSVQSDEAKELYNDFVRDLMELHDSFLAEIERL